MADTGERTQLELALAGAIPGMTRDDEVDASFAVINSGWVPPSVLEHERGQAASRARAQCAADLHALASDDSQIEHGATISLSTLVTLAERWEQP